MIGSKCKGGCLDCIHVYTAIFEDMEVIQPFALCLIFIIANRLLRPPVYRHS